MSDAIHYWYHPEKGYVECSAQDAWDAEERGSMDLGPAYTAPVKKLLTDNGTRYGHISDLLEYLNDGLIAVEASIRTYETMKDQQRRTRLVGAIALVKIYQESLANMDGYKWDLNNMLDRCVPERGILEEIRRARVEARSDIKPSASDEDAGLAGV